MLYREIEQKIKDWIRNPKTALLVDGARQVGKTYSIRKCLNEAQVDYVEINLIKQPDLVEVLKNSEDSDDLVLNLSLATGRRLVKHSTYIFIDEIQQYKDVATKIKFWVDEGAFYYCLSGSLLGVELVNITSAPVGYLSILKMFPLNFNEFLRASGVDDGITDNLKSHFDSFTPVSDYIHKKMMELFRRYIAVGGMPAAVEEYAVSGDMNRVAEIQNNIIELYKWDYTKYETEDKRLMLTRIYSEIPSQLLKQNRRFNYADIEKGLRFKNVEDSFLWLTHAGVSIPAYNATEPRVPLKQNQKSSLVKLYYSDVGLLTCAYGNEAKLMVLMNDSRLNKGGIYENAIIQELNSNGFDVYYYNSHKLGELDFVIECEGTALPIEVKSGKDYYVHSAISNVSSNAEYGIDKAIVFADCNLAQDGKIRYVPIYMAMFLKNEVVLPVLERVEF